MAPGGRSPRAQLWRAVGIHGQLQQYRQRPSYADRDGRRVCSHAAGGSGGESRVAWLRRLALARAHRPQGAPGRGQSLPAMGGTIVQRFAGLDDDWVACRGANGMWHLGSIFNCVAYTITVFSVVFAPPVRNLRTAIWFTSAIRRSAHRGFRAQIELSHPREVQLWRARLARDRLRAHARYSDELRRAQTISDDLTHATQTLLNPRLTVISPSSQTITQG